MLIYSCITHLFYNKGPALHPENGSDVTAPMQVLIDFDESDLSGESQWNRKQKLELVCFNQRELETELTKVLCDSTWTCVYIVQSM